MGPLCMNETLRELLAKQQAILLTHAAEHGQVRRIKKTYTIPGYGLLRRHFPNHVINRLFFQSSFKKFWMGDFEVRTDLPASAQLMFGPRRLATIALACGLDADMVQDVESKFSKQCIPGSPTLISLDSPDVLPQTKALLACWI